MPTYLAVFTGSAESRAASGWDALTDTERSAREAQGIAQWGEWMQKNAARIVHPGGPLSTTMRIGRDGISDTRNALAAFVLIEADSQEVAAELFVNHPHFSVFSGDAVEVMECLPVPGM